MEKNRANFGCFKVGCGLMVAIFVLAAGSLAFLPRRIFDFGRQLTKAELIAILGGDRVAAVLSHPDRVHSVLLNPPPEGAMWDAHNFSVASDEKPVESAIASEIATTLLSPDQQREYPPVSCEPIYGVRTSYFADDDRVDIYFCFECSLLTVYLNNQPVAGINFSFSYRPLITAVQKIHPDNPRLQKLAVRRRN
jgi:hypothetical protein